MRRLISHRWQLRPWQPLLALALIGCGGADRGRPEAIDDGIPGPDLEDLGSGPFRCDQGADLEFELIDDFETGAAHGNFFTNNDVCEICQALIDLRPGGYAQGASLDRLDEAADDLADAPDDKALREELRVELERMIKEFDIWLEDPKFELHHAAAAYYREQFVELLASDLGENELDTIQFLANSRTLDGGNQGVIHDYIQAQREPCREACAATQIPTPVFLKPVPATEVPGMRCGSVYAIHILAGTLTDWGGSLGANFGPPMNVTEWEGISFWARVGTGSRTPIRVELADKHTDEKYEGEDGGPICEPDTTEDTVREGCDKFGMSMQLGRDWKLYTLPFDELRQKGWGKRAPYFDLTGIRAMNILFERGEWDLWVDDIALYRRRQP